MRLIFDDADTHWYVRVIDDGGNTVFEHKNVFFPDQRTQSYFDWWEKQIKQFPNLNITSVQNNIKL